MRKAIITGIITGLILTIILMMGTMCRILLPADTAGANLTFTIIFISAIIIVLWIAMARYSRSTAASLSNLSLVSVIASITTSLVFSTASFIYTRFFSTGYLSDLMEKSRDNWLQRNYSAQSISTQGEWTWYKTPWNFAFNNLQVMLVVLFVISLFIAFVYYSKNRNKVPLHENHNNHELIF
jgi:RsiW-degrading membrane proteinase PrsW (M82 family)